MILLSLPQQKKKIPFYKGQALFKEFLDLLLVLEMQPCTCQHHDYS